MVVNGWVVRAMPALAGPRLRSYRMLMGGTAEALQAQGLPLSTTSAGSCRRQIRGWGPYPGRLCPMPCAGR